MDAAWGAFGSDSESDDDDNAVESKNEQTQSKSVFEATVSAASVAITQHFASLTKATGIGLGERIVAVACTLHGEDCCVEADELRKMMAEGLIRRGMKAITGNDDMGEYDSAVLIIGDQNDLHDKTSLNIRHRLLPGGVLWLIVKSQDNNENGSTSSSSFDCFPTSIWERISRVSTSSSFSVHKIHKRACLVNAMSCPWMDKNAKIEKEVASAFEKTCGNDVKIAEDESYLQFELRLASQVTIVPSVAERTRVKTRALSSNTVYATVLTDANIRNAISNLSNHGLVIIKGLLPPEQTIPWGKVVLDDFTSAVETLKNHATRPVDLLNPDKGIFEPLSYKEMAMREDLRVDLRSGPSMEQLRAKENSLASQAMAESDVVEKSNQPTIITSNNMGTVSSWRHHPSILKILKGLFNPTDATLSKGNFGRWNFGGNGPDGSPQPFRLGQIGSVVSCPGSGDQAIHADTPHLFEHDDCHPCHYCNVFTPGYKITNDVDDELNNKTPSCVQNEFLDGLWTGSSAMGGTALVYESHRLSVSATLLSESDGSSSSDENERTFLRRQLLQLLTLRPALDAGDVVIFDNRTLHYGIANTSKGDTTGKDLNAGRRPLLYLNCSQSWFHDPKNWDDRESIFS